MNIAQGTESMLSAQFREINVQTMNIRFRFQAVYPMNFTRIAIFLLPIFKKFRETKSPVMFKCDMTFHAIKITCCVWFYYAIS
jgi:hypothetical protein